MARYVVEEEKLHGEPSSPIATIEGLAVAKALALKKIRQGSPTIVVRDAETGETMVRYEPEVDSLGPALANSVRRMRAANDRLKEALVPPSQSDRNKKGA
ncbi:MAG TPA: hypothetical protein VF881_01030 [Polyangiaceae bacterium]